MTELSHLKPDLLDCVRGLITTIEGAESAILCTFALSDDASQWEWQTDTSRIGPCYDHRNRAEIWLTGADDPRERTDALLEVLSENRELLSFVVH